MNRISLHERLLIMKRLILLSLSVLTLSLSAATSAKALGRGDRPFSMAMNSNAADTAIRPVDNTPKAVGRGGRTFATVMNANAAAGITPFELASRAYQGAYKSQGISSFGSLHTDFSSGRITAKDLVRAAIEAKDLSPETQTDRAYLNAIEFQLFGERN